MCSLLKNILEKAGLNTHLLGNIGIPCLDHLNKIKSNDWMIIELSSFQLSTFKQRFQRAVVLNTTVEHLDWHTNVQNYWECKFHITQFQQETDTLFYNRSSGGSWGG